MVRALIRLVRIFSRSLIGGPVRRLAGFLARRAFRARPRNQTRLLVLLAAALLVVYRELRRRLARLPEAKRAAIRLGLRGLRRGAPAVWRLARRLLHALTALARSELAGRLAAARRARQ